MKELIEAYVQAAINLSWIGYTEPEFHESTRQEYDKAKEAVYAKLDSGERRCENSKVIMPLLFPKRKCIRRPKCYIRKANS
jgi:hypothetical protein